MKFYSRTGSGAPAAGRATLQPELGTLRLREGAFRISADRLLSLAAAPTFALMALLTSVLGSADILCSSAKASPLTGMVLMYLLMSAFHLAPWLRLISGRRSG
ncbi:hypothetical protein JQ628_12450 [Bradyrhizobium lablabi]|uniref:hypothetical protein n=1 Tax=Bradyrhizobium lablabi TaxID=722472 RepID=UPI001BADD7AB|nr:hypothetical protein [Bradyrhizobium lablabi]MBR1122328.1 hypothetical protein [Bradyrhizobium lablabi]